jgi:DNA-binding FadR family transcriptional regulator
MIFQINGSAIRKVNASPTVNKDTGADAARIPKFRPIRAPRAFEEIVQQIRAEISEGRLKVGSRLPTERELSEEFNVSRNTVREALRSLEHAGLIHLKKGSAGGAFICEPSAGAISTGLMDMYHLGAVKPAQLTQARIWLESIVVREACQHAAPADIEALNANIAAAERASKDGDFLQRTETNLDFHRLLARMTANPIMVTVMNGVLDVLREFVLKIGDSDNPSYVVPSRRRFMKHFAAGNAEAAVIEMESSLKKLQRSYLSRDDAPADGDQA